MTAPAPGRRIGRYVVEATIGTGAFATVLRARDEALDGAVAVKLLADNHALDPALRERFAAEGRVLRRIGPPHVVQVHDLGETDRAQPYLVLELAELGNLAARVEPLRRDGWRPTDEDLRAVLLPMAEALAAVHAAEVVHRDLAPTNLLLTRDPTAAGTDRAPLLASDERLVLADLGMAKDLARSSGLTVAGGTAGFQPPEQLVAPSRVDGRADVWALAAVGAWMALGEVPPQRGRDLAARLQAAGLGEAVAAGLVAALEPEPCDRPTDMAAFAAALDRGRPGHAHGRGMAHAIEPAEPAVGVRRRRALAIAAATLLLAVLGVLATVERGGPSVDVVDGVRTSTIVRDGLDVRLEGPTSVRVGEQALLAVQGSGVDALVWVGPDGSTVRDAPALRLAPTTTGTAVVRLLVTGAGEQVELEHVLDVLPAE